MQRLPAPVGNGWELSEGIVKPVLMMQEAAPEGLVELAVCKCDKSLCKFHLRCLCRTNERGGEWSFKISGSRKILVEFHGSRSLVFLAVMCVSQSRFLYEGVSESRFFPRLREFPRKSQS